MRYTVIVALAAAFLRLPTRDASADTAGRALHVDPVTGDDTHAGLAGPVKTIARAVKFAQPGDTIHLTPGTYFKSADLSNKHGLPGKPITLDGHGGAWMRVTSNNRAASASSNLSALPAPKLCMSRFLPR